MVILTDTREQQALRFPISGAVTEVRVVTLPVGDYHCEYADGSRPPVFFERKSKSDLWGTMTKGYDRFRREILLAQHHGWKLVLIVECPLAEVYDGFGFSEYAGSSMVRKVFTLWVKYGLQVVFSSDRTEMAAYIAETYEAIGRCWKAGKRSMPASALFGGLQAPLDLSGDVAGED